MDKDNAMADELDALLADGLLDVPEHFSQQVMARVWAAPLQVSRSVPPHSWQARLQKLALLGGALWGTVQLMGFIFGIWAATSAA